MKAYFIIAFLFFTFHLYPQQEHSTYLDLNIDSFGNNIPCNDTIKKHIRKEFYLNSIKYAIDIKEDDEALLYISENNINWTIKDTLSAYSSITQNPIGCEILFPSVEITDFNKDGFEDLLYQDFVNMHGERWVIIFLHNLKTKQLEILQNNAEGDIIWADPIYDKKKKIISCTKASGQFGVSFTSTYSLIGQKAIPLKKKKTTQPTLI